MLFLPLAQEGCRTYQQYAEVAYGRGEGAGEGGGAREEEGRRVGEGEEEEEEEEEVVEAAEGATCSL